MSGASIPVRLEFQNVAANASLSINFTTTGIQWSMGSTSGDSIGFSYNVVPSDIDDRNSCIKHISFNDSVLSIITSPDAPQFNSFTLTISLLVGPNVEYLQGYCTLNNEAQVLAYFGNLRPIVWRNGRFSAVLEKPSYGHSSLQIGLRGVRAGERITISVTTRPELGEVSWSLGPPGVETLGISLTSSRDTLSLESFTYMPDRIVIDTDELSGQNSLDLVMHAHISWFPLMLPYIHLRAHGNNVLNVYAQVGTRQPQYISPVYTLLTLR